MLANLNSSITTCLVDLVSVCSRISSSRLLYLVLRVPFLFLITGWLFVLTSSTILLITWLALFIAPLNPAAPFLNCSLVILLAFKSSFKASNFFWFASIFSCALADLSNCWGVNRLPKSLLSFNICLKFLVSILI